MSTTAGQRKCVFVINEELRQGEVGNVAAILGVSLGKLSPDMVGQDIVDNDGDTHSGITTFALPVLKASAADLMKIRNSVKDNDAGLKVVDVTRDTQATLSYREYLAAVRETSTGELVYYGIALFGETKTVNSHTGSLPLMR